MMKAYEYYILNVFSDSGMEGGNQLAVIPDSSGLTDEQMQQITRQFNFAESTFITKKYGNVADVRIFTPGMEIAYAGHPTIGTMYILEFLHQKEREEPYLKWTLNLLGGTVSGNIKMQDGGIGIAGFKQLSSQFKGYYEDRRKLLNFLGITSNELFDEEPFHMNGVTSMKFLFVRLKDKKSLAKLSPQFKKLSCGEFKLEDINVYCFVIGDRIGDIRGRFFAPNYGITEDPATGSAQNSLGLCLLNLGLLKNNSTNEVCVEQGYELGRPSKLYSKFVVKDDKLVEVYTAGNCYLFSEGNFKLEIN